MAYTWIDDDIVVCDDCGASTTLGHELLIEHYPVCEPGAAEFWEKYYGGADNE